MKVDLVIYLIEEKRENDSTFCPNELVFFRNGGELIDTDQIIKKGSETKELKISEDVFRLARLTKRRISPLAIRLHTEEDNQFRCITIPQRYLFLVNMDSTVIPKDVILGINYQDLYNKRPIFFIDEYELNVVSYIVNK